MAQKDYIVDPGLSEVTFKGATVATYDAETKKVVDYKGDGSKRKRWIAHALRDAPDLNPNQNFDIESDDAFETAIAIAEYEVDVYSIFPSAPRPASNPVGHKHVEIYNWIKNHHEPILEYMYPEGPWNPLEAGMERNRTIRPIKEAEKAVTYLN